MERLTKRRAGLFLILFLALVTFFGYQLFDKQVIETGGVVDNSTTYITKTRVKAARGDILDTNGNVLIGNRASYNLVINHYVLQNSENPNESLYRLVQMCQSLGIEYVDHLPVTREKPFTYTLDQQNSTWRGYFQQFLSNRGSLDSDISAPLLIETLRESYGIPAEWTDEEARLVLGLRYELTLRNFVNLSTFVLITDARNEDISYILELNIPGLSVESSTVREYYTTYAAHILGYVGAMSPAQWEERKDLGVYSMDAEIGQSGFEQAFEEYLRGTDGWRYDEVTPDGTVVRSWYDPMPQAGNHVEVTIDISLQAIAEEQLARRILELQSQEDPTADGKDVQSGAVVVMNVKTGEVLACASYPTYDLTTFRQNFAELNTDPTKPMYNRALSAAFPPGSTYKMSMVVTAINAGNINMTDTIEDLGVFNKYEGFSPKCLRYTNSGTTHGHITAAEALCVSCNYFFYELGDRLPIATVDATAAALGLGEYTGIELDENKGWRSNPETKAHFQSGSDAQWYQADKIHNAIGQGENRFTPMQLCVYVSTLANRGTRMQATFLNRVVSTDYRSLVLDNQPEIANVLEISEDAYQAYTEGMRMVTSAEGGTAYWVFYGYPIAVAGKTGTAQTGISGQSDNGAFVCYAPFDDPEIAIAVYGERAGSGKGMSYVAKSIMDTYFSVGEVSEVATYENKFS